MDKPVAPSDRNHYSRYYTYIQPIIKNQAVRSFAPYIFSLFTVAFFAVFVIQPTISTILVLNKEIEESRQILTALQTKSQNLETGRQNLEALDPSLRTKINALVPADPAITTIVKSLQNARESTTPATIIQIQPLTLIDTVAASTNVLNEASFNYSTQGAYSDLMAFLKTINKLPRLITIDSLTVGKQGGEVETSLSVSGRAFYLR